MIDLLGEAVHVVVVASNATIVLPNFDFGSLEFERIKSAKAS
jgi:hypothetical protein